MKQVAQLALAVQLPDDETFESLYYGANDVVLKQLQSFVHSLTVQEAEQPSGFYLFGLSGVGKSHLLHAVCSYSASL